MRRRVTDDEAALLAKALADVRPLKRRRKKKPAPALQSGAAATPRTAVALARPSAAPKPAAPAPAPKGKISAAPKEGVFEAGDPRIETKARRGRIDIERTLDLHGLRQDAAHARLVRFVDAAYRDDCQCVLVVTGKGSRIDALARMADPAPRGVIRAGFLEWIEEPALRARIVRVGNAAPRHGGSGAFYVFLKRRR